MAVCGNFALACCFSFEINLKKKRRWRRREAEEEKRNMHDFIIIVLFFSVLVALVASFIVDPAGFLIDFLDALVQSVAVYLF